MMFPSFPVRLPLALAAILLASTAARADIRDERICAGLDAGDAFAACSKIVATGAVQPDAIARAYTNRAAIWDRQGKIDQAMADYDLALRFDANLTAALFNRAALWLKKNEIDRALADLDRAVVLAPRDAEILFRRGSVRAQRADIAGALADFDAAIAIAPREKRLYLARSLERQKAGQLDAALADSDIAIALDPNDVDGYINRGALRSTKGLVDQAIADFDIALRLNPKSPPALVNRASLLERKGDRERALKDYQTAQALDPDYAPAHNGVAWALLKLGRAAAALAHVERALALEPNSVEALDTRAGILEALGKLEEAFADVSRARSIDPKSPETLETFNRIKTKFDAKIAVRRDAPADNPVVVALKERRVALVIGNAAYRGVAPLKNPVNDAEAVAAKLKSIGFTSVTLVVDATREQLVGRLATFSREAEQADWAVVYYAGHGMQISGENWIIPVDASLKTDRDLKLHGISLDQVRTAVDGAKKLRLVVLDACRDNPFLAAMRAANGTRSLARGLARVEPGASLVVFAAKDNQVALDGNGRNSPFAEALLRHMGTPGLEIDRLFRRVSAEVLRETGDKQEPHTYGRLPDADFFFMPPEAVKAAGK